MPDMSDKELDRLFREAAEGIRPEFDPEDWARLEQRLEYVDRGASTRGISLWSMAGLLLLMFGWSELNQIVDSPTTYTEAKNKSTNVEINKSTEEVIKVSTQIAGENLQSINNNTTKTDLSNNHNKLNNRNGNSNHIILKANTPEAEDILNANRTTTFPIKNNSMSSDNKSSFNADNDEGNIKSDLPFNALSAENNTKVATANINTVSEASRMSLEKVSQRDPLTTQNANSTLANNNSFVVQTKGLRDQKNVVINEAEEYKNSTNVSKNGFSNSLTNPIVREAKSSNKKTIKEHSTADLSKTDSIFIHDSIYVTILLPAREDTIITKKKDRRETSWFIKLPISPDYTSINYGATDKPGVNIGLLLEVQPLNHVSITAGAIWSRKLYTTETPGRTYGAPDNLITVHKIKGDCRVLDIPLNITYYIDASTRTNFFVSAGISSYIMLKEKYAYDVTGKTGNYWHYESYNHKNNEWLSMLNLSIGVQRQLSKNFFLQAEPFLKAPLKGVGQGKVDLVSMGAFVTIKYKLK